MTTLIVIYGLLAICLDLHSVTLELIVVKAPAPK